MAEVRLGHMHSLAVIEIDNLPIKAFIEAVHVHVTLAEQIHETLADHGRCQH